uniref:BLOC-1-related complex subunit 7 n=1 Tax=Lygus hesperus TaxID=30085 RepID=A0A0A9XL16_LYGHE
MASASSTSAKSLFAESKTRLADRVQNNVNNIASLTRQIQRGSKTNEIIMTSARNFVAQEQTIVNSENTLKKTLQMMDRMNYDHLSVVKSATAITEAVQQTAAMQR